MYNIPQSAFILKKKRKTASFPLWLIIYNNVANILKTWVCIFLDFNVLRRNLVQLWFLDKMSFLYFCRTCSLSWAIDSLYWGRGLLFFYLDGTQCLISTAAAATKSLQSCPTLCDPIDGSPPGSAVPGILQARTPEWVAISFSNAWKWKVKVKSLSRVWLSETPQTAAYQAPLSMGFSRQEYWSGVPLPSPELIFYSRSMMSLSHISLYFAFFSVYFFSNFHYKYVQSFYCTSCSSTTYILSLYFCAILWVVSLKLTLQHNYWVFNLNFYMFVAKESLELIYKVKLLLSLNCLSLWTLIHRVLKFNLIL